MAEPLSTFIARLRKYPGMYMPRVSFMTACAFIDGYALASGDPLRDFHQWLVQRGTTRPELGWPWLVLGEIYPVESLPDPGSLSADEDAAAVGVLFDLLAEYFTSRPPTGPGRT